MLHRQDDDKDNKRQAQILKRAEVRRAVAAAERVDADADEAEANGKDDGTRDDRREEAAQRFQEETEHSLEQAADDRCSHDGTVGNKAAAHRGRHGIEHADEARRRAHNDGNPAANRPDAEKLDQGHNACDPHGVLQQRQLDVGELGPRQAARACHDQKRRQIAHEHGQNMLQAQGNRLSEGHVALEREDAERPRAARRLPRRSGRGLLSRSFRRLSLRSRLLFFLHHLHPSLKGQ